VCAAFPRDCIDSTQSVQGFLVSQIIVNLTHRFIRLQSTDGGSQSAKTSGTIGTMLNCTDKLVKPDINPVPSLPSPPLPVPSLPSPPLPVPSLPSPPFHSGIIYSSLHSKMSLHSIDFT